MLDKVLSKLPFDYKDPMAIGVFVLVVALAVVAAKKLPYIGSKV